MRVAVFVGTFPATSETFILNHVTGLLDRGHDVDIYPFETSADPARVHPEITRYELLARTHRTPAFPTNRVARIARGLSAALSAPRGCRWRLLKTLNPLAYGRTGASVSVLRAAMPLLPARDYDVLHCHFGTPGERAAILRKLGFLRGKLVATFHGSDAVMPGKALAVARRAYRCLFAEADAVLAVSDAVRDRLWEIGCPRSKVKVFAQGVDLASFPVVPRLLAPSEPVRFLSVARLEEVKGLEHALRAMATLAARGVAFEYAIVGGGSLEATLRSLVAELGLTDRVSFLGWKTRDEIPALLERSHVLVVPSLREGKSVAIMEGMASGIPVVATRAGGIPELVDDGVSGLLVPPADAGALATALEHVATHSGSWESMGRAGRARVERDHDNSVQIDALVRLFHDLG